MEVILLSTHPTFPPFVGRTHKLKVPNVARADLSSSRSGWRLGADFDLTQTSVDCRILSIYTLSQH